MVCSREKWEVESELKRRVENRREKWRPENGKKGRMGKEERERQEKKEKNDR